MERIEIITRTERRRRHSDADRERILAEAAQPGVTVKSVSQEYDVAESLIYGWLAARRKRQAINSELLEFINDSPICGDRMDLKNVLGQIKADGGNLHGGWLLMLVFA
jgi:Transposase